MGLISAAAFPVSVVAIGAVVYWLGCRMIDRTADQGGAPSCFLSDPGPQQQAENDCAYCPFANACLN